MDYSKYLKNVKSASKNDLKKLVFTLDNEQVKKIKSMNLNEVDEARLISMCKDRAFFDMLLINALK